MNIKTCDFSFIIPDTIADCDPCHNCDKCKLVEFAKCKSVSLANKYVTLATYGNPKAQSALDRLLVIRSLIKTVETYYTPNECDFSENMIINFRGKKISMSKNNSLYLEQKKTPIRPDDVNCLSEEQMDLICSRLDMLTFEC